MKKLVWIEDDSNFSAFAPKRIAEEFPEIAVAIVRDRPSAVREIAAADMAYGELDPELLQSASRLVWLQSPYAGPKPEFYFRELIESAVIVTNMRGLWNDHISDHVMACVLAFARNLPHYMHLQSLRIWQPAPDDAGVVHLPGSTLLIVGAGGIGQSIAAKAKAFGLHVIATDARETVCPAGVDELHPASALDSLLPMADFVVLTVPHTPETDRFMALQRFRRMKSSAFFINVGRGMTTVLDDLVLALQGDIIAGAALDVFDQEPLPAVHPLWRLPNVILTPHVSGYGPFVDDRRMDVMRRNCAGFLAGRPLINVVDKANRF